jgi:Phage Tail Collar Domain
MSGYQILFSDPSKNFGNNIITVADGTENTNNTSITLVGRNYPGYGQAVNENFVHMLENFSSSSSPLNPIQGQLWYDTSDPTKYVLRVFDGAGIGANHWPPINGLWQTGANPSQNARIGDIWVDTNNTQLSIFNGTDFTLVGPNYSSTSKTGTYSTTLNDISNNSHTVVINYVNGSPIEIISTEDGWNPNPIISGFSTIYSGVNVSSNTKINGIASAAYNLQLSIPSAQTVPADSFLRKDIDQRMLGALTVAADSNSIRIGSDGTFVVERNSVTPYNAAFKNVWPTDGEFSFNLQNAAGVTVPVMIIKQDTANDIRRVGINNIGYPTETLDVTGSGKFNGFLTVTDTADYSESYTGFTGTNLTRVAGPAFEVSGGAYIGKNAGVYGTLIVGGEHVVRSFITTGNSGSNAGDPALVPFKSGGVLSIGTASGSFGTVYGYIFQAGSDVPGAAQFIGIATQARQLSQSTNFYAVGDIVTTATIAFNGSAGSDVKLSTSATTALITSKASTSTAYAGDDLMLYTQIPSAQLVKISKANFLSDVGYTDPGAGYGAGSLVPTGTVISSAAATSTNFVSAGWLVCNGGSYTQTQYPALWNALRLSGYPYGGSGSSFNIPQISPIATTNGPSIYYIIKT